MIYAHLPMDISELANSSATPYLSEVNLLLIYLYLFVFIVCVCACMRACGGGEDLCAKDLSCNSTLFLTTRAMVNVPSSVKGGRTVSLFLRSRYFCLARTKIYFFDWLCRT